MGELSCRNVAKYINTLRIEESSILTLEKTEVAIKNGQSRKKAAEGIRHRTKKIKTTLKTKMMSEAVCSGRVSSCCYI